ncbi:ribosome maturation factor RimM [Pseudomonadales bacterium]|nr:ribosome maturation factor RimM [Pseudomonadales bacterium]MDB2595283.1 ribosome maturation factor RimM [Pseudomonadales bacterium]
MSLDIIVVGRLGRSFGVKGWQVLQSFTDPPENILQYAPWYLQRSPDSPWQALATPACQPHKNGHIVRLEHIQNPEDAHAYSGSFIGVPRDALSASEITDDSADAEYFWHDLVGCDVYNLDGMCLGKVDHLIETGAHDVLIVKSEEGNHLIPFHEPYLQNVDLTAKRISVEWHLDWS